MVIQSSPHDGLRELALFAGAGGGILGGKLLGWRTICAVEQEPYAIAVLLARQNDSTFAPFPIWDDVCTFDGKPWRGRVDVVSGGFPCQDISAAGKGAGLDGERSGLWSEMARIISEVQPQYAFIENSPMLVTRGLDRVLCDLAAMGFDAKWGIVSAANTGAPHKRDRIWIKATNTSGKRCNDGRDYRQGRHVLHDINRDAAKDQSEWQGRECGARSSCENVANANSQCSKGIIPSDVNQVEWQESDQRQVGSQSYGHRQWPTEPDVGRVVNGMAFRSHRIKAIGNGQVPRVFASAWHLLRGEVI